jgi:Conjugal transfer protein TraD
MAQIDRSQAAKARDDTRCWAKERRERTRRLIELGGLVQKSGLVALLDDDRATILGALLESAGRLKSEGQAEEEIAGTKALWRR